MRPLAGTLATFLAVGGGVLAAGFGTLLAGWHIIVDTRSKD